MESVDMLAALRAQDPAVARPLWERFAPTILRMLRCTLGPQAQIDDAAQVVLLCVFKRARRLPPRSDLKQFVVRVTAGIARGELRRRRLSWCFPSSRGARRKAAAHARSQPLPAAVLRFYRIIDRLSTLDRLAFVLHHVEGLEVRAVASALGASSAQTSRRLRRGLGKVIKGIEGDPEAERRLGRPAQRRSRSWTSNSSVALAGITPPAPRAP